MLGSYQKGVFFAVFTSPDVVAIEKRPADILGGSNHSLLSGVRAVKLHQNARLQLIRYRQFVVDTHIVVDNRCLAPKLRHVGAQFAERRNIRVNGSFLHRVQEMVLLRQFGL